MTTFENRPKPPSITGVGRLEYERRHQVITVCRSVRGVWLVYSYKGAAEFPTHAEAIAYAHKIANERSTR